MNNSVKYKRYFQLMFDQNQAIFTDFKIIHDQYALDREKYEDQFHTQGMPLLDVIRDWERRLCSGMERGQYAGYSSKLSEKFWQEVKTYLPLIEEVGVRTN